MARSRLHDTKQDLISDTGSVLWSIVHGEQLVLPAHLKFIHDVFDSFVFDAWVIEGENFEGQSRIPDRARLDGARTQLAVSLPSYAGVWSAAVPYNAGQSVSYNGGYYTLSVGILRLSSVPPSEDEFWFQDKANKVLIQFPGDLIEEWEVKPTPKSPVYGFFELVVNETSVSFPRTWKPIRGIVEILYSPIGRS
jgi:hypothetical protein